jgi:hypothetical protein
MTGLSFRSRIEGVEDAMQAVLVLAAVIVLAGCTGTSRPAADAQASGGPAERFESAPTINPTDYHMPPDLRDKVCGERHIGDQSFATNTKASGSSFCF